MRIYPTVGSNFSGYSKKTTFKGFYDPTCQSIPAAMKEKVKQGVQEIGHSAPVKAAIDEFKSKVGILENKAQVLDNEGSVLKHILPDGSTTIDIPTGASVESARVLDANNILIPKETNIASSSDLSSVSDNAHGGSVLRHILPDGTTTVDIPTDATAEAAHLVDASNILIPEHSSVLEHLIDNGSDVPVDDTVSAAIDAGSNLGDVAGTLLDSASDHLDNLKDILHSIL